MTPSRTGPPPGPRDLITRTSVIKTGMDSDFGFHYGNRAVMPAQVVLLDAVEPSATLRSRKKERTRAAIQDAALDLFAEQGFDATTVDQIAVRAEISTTTFFTYFRSKAEVIVSDHSKWLPAFQQAIVVAPPTESDLDAMKHALQGVWVTSIDLERTVRQAQAVATSHVLRGVSYDMGQIWLGAVANALARRHGLDTPDDRCWIGARVALTILGHVLQSWMGDGCHGELTELIDHGFSVMGAARH